MKAKMEPPKRHECQETFILSSGATIRLLLAGDKTPAFLPSFPAAKVSERLLSCPLTFRSVVYTEGLEAFGHLCSAVLKTAVYMSARPLRGCDYQAIQPLCVSLGEAGGAHRCSTVLGWSEWINAYRAGTVASVTLDVSETIFGNSQPKVERGFGTRTTVTDGIRSLERAVVHE